MCHIVLSLFFNKYKQKMTKKERVAVVIDTLEELFPNPAIPLDHINTYTFLIAVLMSAQTTDAMVG
jgi:endonuclease-3